MGSRQNRICVNILIKEKVNGRTQSGIYCMIVNYMTNCLRYRRKSILISLDLYNEQKREIRREDQRAQFCFIILINLFSFSICSYIIFCFCYCFLQMDIFCFMEVGFCVFYLNFNAIQIGVSHILFLKK